MSRETRTALVDVDAQCEGCGWRSNARNAVGNAARHHDATGHCVTVDVTRRVVYGDPDAPMPGQTTIDDMLPEKA